MADGYLNFDTKLDTSGFEKGLSGLSKIGATAAKAVAAVGTGLASGAGYAVKLASDLNEVQNVVDVTFGDKAGVINDWAKSVGENYGLAELQAKQFAGTMGSMLKSMGVGASDVENMSTSMAQLAGDFASFYNLGIDEAFEKIRSGISGEIEPLKQLGINMSVANLQAYALSQGLQTQYKDMTQAEQAALRYAYLMQASADAQGDFSRTSDSFANQLRAVQLELTTLASSIGQGLLPIAREGLGFLTEQLGNVAAAFDAGGVEAVSEALGTALANIITQVANMAPDLIAAAVQLVTSFAQGIIDNSGAIADALHTAIDSGLTSIGDAVPALEPLTNIIQTIVDNLDILLPIALDVGAAFLGYQAAIAIINGVSTAQAILNAVLMLNPIGLIVAAVAALVAGLIYLWNTNDGFREAVKGAWEVISGAIGGAIDAIIKFFTQTIPDAFNKALEFFKNLPQNILQFFNELPGKIGYAIGLVLGTLVKWGADAVKWVTTEVPKIIDGIINFFKNLPGKIADTLKSVVGKVIEWNAEMISTIVREFPKFISRVIDFFKELPGKIFDIGGDIVRGLWDGITSMVDWLKDKIFDFAGGIIDGFKDALGIHSPSRVMRDQIGKMIPRGIKVGFEAELPDIQKAMAVDAGALVEQMQDVIAAKQADIAMTLTANDGLKTANNTNYSTTTTIGSIFDKISDTLIVREGADIDAIAERIYAKFKQATRSKGVVAF